MLRVELKVVGGKRHGKSIPLPTEKFLIGREEDCQLRPKSELVSRHHCVFTIDDFEVALRDLGSTNGTMVNGKPIRGRVVLAAGDQIRIGNLDFELVIRAAEPVPAEPTPAAAEVETEQLSTTDTMFELPAQHGQALADTTANAASDTGDTTVIHHSEQPQQPAVTQPPPEQMPVQPQPAPPQQAVPQQPVPQQPIPQQPIPPVQQPIAYPQQPIPYPELPPGYQQPVPYAQPPAPYPQPVPYPQQPGQYPQPGMPYPQQPVMYPQQQPVPAPQPPIEEEQASDSVEVLPVQLPDPTQTGADPEKTVGSSGVVKAGGKSEEESNPSDMAADIIKQMVARRPNT